MHFCRYNPGLFRVCRIIRSKRAFLIRLSLVPVAVLVCYRFDWYWLRALTANLTVKFTVVAGVHWVLVGRDLALYRGQLFQFLIGCTLADAWCGAIPLIWKRQDSVLSNLVYAGALAVGMFALNISRLTLVNLISAAGPPWRAAHDSLSAITYLIVWIAIQRRSAWRAPSSNYDNQLPDSGSAAQVPNPI